MALSVIQIRRDSAANWASENTVLESGEWGFDETNGIVKIGNGSTAWNSLAVGFKVGLVMHRDVYDTDNDGVVDNSELLGGQTSGYHLDRANHTGSQLIATITGLQAALDNKIETSEKAAANGVATLDSGGKIPLSQMPATAVTDVYVAADIAARDALTVQEGDVAIVLDATADPDVGAAIRVSYIYDGTNWQRMNNQDSVTSVNGQTGVVVLTTTNIAEGTNLYHTSARVLAVVLAGLSLADDSAVTSSDTILVAMGKLQAQMNGKEPALPSAGGSPATKYLRGDKTWQVLDKTAVGLGNLDNLQQLPMSYLDTSTTLGGGSASNTKVPSQLAVKTYVDNELATAIANIDGGNASAP